jgi:hypothetical protein
MLVPSIISDGVSEYVNATKRALALNTQQQITLGMLKQISVQLEELDEKRDDLIKRRDELVRELRPHASARVIGQASGLSTSGIYKIESRETQ